MYRRYMLMVSTVFLSMSDRGRTDRLQALSGRKASESDSEDMRQELLDFIVGGMKQGVNS